MGVCRTRVIYKNKESSNIGSIVKPDMTGLFIFDTDVSQNAIRAQLSQVQGGQEKVIAYASLSLSPEQRRYCTTWKEHLAVVRFTRQFRQYLLGRQFLIPSDHSSLTWLLSFKNPQGQLARWLEQIQYDNKASDGKQASKC